MQLSRRDFFRVGGLSVAALGWGGLEWQPARALATNDPILHLLNRITWGTRPEDYERASAIGYEAYLEEHLNPEQLDDTYIDGELQRHPILRMDRHQIHQVSNAEHRAYQTLVDAFLLRATHSRRQLLERMVDFWTDHFNVSSEDILPDMVIYQREAIRAHALGNFKDMLVATARQPAMLFYLDNYLNVADHPNENYARELLELHTLGVDGGYTEEDVLAVARAFTGWTIHNATPTGFFFSEEEHDRTAKQVLGHNLPAGRGIADGLHVLNIVATHPATAQFLSRKLCVRFVSDTPPQSLVDSTATVWRQHNGEIKPVLRHIFLSEEFRQSVGQKFRRPLDFLVGALRATGTRFRDWWMLWETLNALGQLPYGWTPPDGYPDTASAWLSTSGLLARWNVAMLVTHSAYSESEGQLHTELLQRIGQPRTASDLVDAVARQVFGVSLSEAERQPFLAYVSSNPTAPVTMHLLAQKLGTLYGLMLASPLYQWR